MVKNKRELIAAHDEWMGVALNDLRRHMMAFMQKTRIDENRLANILDVPVAQIRAIINGRGEVSLSLFAKILIATNNVIVITPADAMPSMGGMPMPPCAPRRHPGMSMTPPPGVQMPARDARGRFVSRHAEPVPQPMDFNFGETAIPFPHPDPNGQLPSPEELMEMNGFDAANLEDETTNNGDDFMGEPDTNIQENFENHGETDEHDDIAIRLARALRSNPEISDIFREMLG